MAKYISNRQQNIKIGIVSYTEDKTVLEVTGKVGIGTTNATSKLHVIGDARVTGVVTASSFRGDGSQLTGVTGTQIVTQDSISTPVFLTFANNIGVTSLGVATTGSNVLSVIPSLGNLGIGTTNPQQKLWVEGNGYFTGILTANRIFSSQYGEFVGGSISGTSVVGTSLSISGISTLGVTSTTNLTSQQLNVSGITTLGVTSTTNLTSQQLNVSGITTLGVTSTTNLTSQQLNVSGITTLGVTSATNLTSQQLNVSGITTLGVTSTTNLTSQQLNVSGISTFTNGPVLIGGGTSTGTAGQVLQVTGINSSVYIGGNLGIGTTNATSKLHVIGDVRVSGAITATTFVGALTGIATFATNAGIATFATNAGIATFATNAGIATFATNAGIATYATNAGIATFATNAGIATFATNAGIATFATNAGISTFATNAGIATFATNAGISTFATNAGIATFATNAGIATYATNAGIATNVIGGIASVTQLNVSGVSTLGTVKISSGIITATTGIVTYFGDGSNLQGIQASSIVGVTSFATNAGIATFATNAGIATFATTAGIATFATTAGIATNVIGGIASVTQLNVSGVSTLGIVTSSQLYVSGVVTASQYFGDGSQLTGVTGVQIVTQDPISTPVFLTFANNAGVSTLGVVTTGPNALVFIPASGNLGIGTTNPTSKLTVQGDVLVSGISTLGTVKISSGIITASSGIVTYFGDGSNLQGIRASSIVGVTSFATNAGIATNVIGGIGSITQLNVSGVSTLGTVKISSGIITASSGIVTYFGDGSNLQGIQASSIVGVTSFATNAGIATNLKGGLVGNVPYQSATDTTVFLTNGSSGTILQSNGIGNAPSWVSAAPAAAITGLTIRDEGTIVGSANSVSELNFVGPIVSVASTAGIATITFLDYVSNAGIATFATNAGIATFATNAGIATFATNAGIATFATNAGIATFATNAGIATFTSEWILGAVGSSDYTFTGPGFTGAESDPVLYLVRGQQYKFTNIMGAHPFRIQSTPNGSAGTEYNDGITNNNVSNGTLTWNVQFDAPGLLYYQCTAHGSMGGKIYIIDAGIGPDVSVNTTGIITASSFVGTALSISGISTLGTVKISSGIITASSGIVTYFGDGSNLQGIQASSIVGVTSFAINAGVSTNVIGGIGSITQLQVTGVSTFTNGPVLIGSATSTGTASQPLQVTGGAYVSSNLGIGTTNPQQKLWVEGNGYFTGILTANRIFSSQYGEFVGGSISGTNVVGTSLSISGISTLGTVKISSGIITATSGVVTYYGDGRYLDLTNNSRLGIGSTFTSGAVNGNLFYHIDYGKIFVYYDEVALGIGTDAFWVDAAPFNVGIITSLTNVSFSSGSAISPSMFFVGNNQTGFFSPGSGQFTVVSSGSSILNINPSGVVVTGVTTSTKVRVGTASTFTEDLVVNGSARVVGILTIGSSSITLNGTSNIINVGTGITINGNTGIVSATSFFGDGSGLTGAGSTVFNNTTTNQEFFPLFTATTSGTITASGISTSKLTYNPSTGTVTATAFVGNGSGLTGAGSTVFNNTTTNQEFFPLFTATTSGTITASGISTSKLTYNPSTGAMTAVDFNSTSDINLKENIHTVGNALEITKQLRGVSFDWKETGRSSYGVIAQELEEVLPELVKNGEVKSVNYNGIIGVLIEAIKELKKEVEDLKETKYR